MKIKKDTTTKNVLILDADGVVVAMFTPGAYVVRVTEGVVTIGGPYGSFDLPAADVTHTLIDGAATAVTTGTVGIITWLNATGFNFASV